MTKLTHSSSCRDTNITIVLFGMHIVNETKCQLKSLLCDLEITMNQWLVLIIVYLKFADTPTNISNFMKIDAPAITRYVDKLVQNGFMERERYKNDRRVIRVKLTTKGLRDIEKVCDHYNVVLDGLENHLTQNEIKMWKAVKKIATSDNKQSH